MGKHPICHYIYIYKIEIISILLTQLSIRVEHYQLIFEVMELKAHILFSTSKVDDTVCFNYFSLFVVSCHSIFVVIYDIIIYFLQCSGDEIKHLLKGCSMCCYYPCNIGKILLDVLNIPSWILVRISYVDWITPINCFKPMAE